MKINKCRNAFAALVMTVCSGLGAAEALRAQDVVGGKTFQQWSSAEVERLLTDSLWAKTQVIRIQRQGQPRSVAGGPDRPVFGEKDQLKGAEEPLDYRFTLRLYSALPVRQALVRQEQLKWGYDKRSAAEQKAFDAQAKQLILDCAVCAENYVISVGFRSTNSSGIDFIYQWFGSATVPSIKGYVYLANERGERRDLVDFIPPKSPGDDVYFVFPRLDEKGQPLFTAADKKLLFFMADNSAKSITNFRLDISRLIADGKVGF
jgi:hypothetical protein